MLKILVVDTVDTVVGVVVVVSWQSLALSKSSVIRTGDPPRHPVRNLVEELTSWTTAMPQHLHANWTLFVVHQRPVSVSEPTRKDPDCESWLTILYPALLPFVALRMTDQCLAVVAGKPHVQCLGVSVWNTQQLCFSYVPSKEKQSHPY